jgi:predicted TIM-barrel fold metal-dependent hydrolase
MIDAHCHFGPGLRAQAPFGPLFKADTTSDLLALLDGVGIDKAVIFAPSWNGGWDGVDFNDPSYERANAAVAEAVHAYPDRFIGFARVNPKFGSAAIRELRRCFEDYGFRGLKLDNEADGFHPTDLRLLGPLAELVRENGGPIIVHTGFHPCEPLIYLPLAQAFPDVPLILGHMGGRILIDAVITAQHASNVYLETSGQQPGYIARAVKAVGPDRVIFGTDIPYNIPVVEVERIKSIGLSPADLNKITHGTAAGLLRLAERSPAAA